MFSSSDCSALFHVEPSSDNNRNALAYGGSGMAMESLGLVYEVCRDVALHSADVAHGSYEIWGLCRAYLSGRYNVSKIRMMPFANTFSEVESLLIGIGDRHRQLA
jgi:hypothetical protein